MGAWSGKDHSAGKTIAFALLAVAVLAAGMAAPHDFMGSLYAHTSMLTVHLLMELFAIIIAMLVVVVSWNDFNARHARSISILICGFTIVAICDVFHALTYEGMPALLAPSSTPRAIFFWLMGRTFEVSTLALMAVGIAPSLPRRFWLGSGLAISGFLIWLGSYQIDFLPVTFIKGQGVTPFKADYEYVLCALNVGVALLFWGRARTSGENRDYLLCLSSFVMGLGELMFTDYVQSSDFQNIYGHSFKVVAYALLFRATFLTSIRAPFDFIRQSQSELRESEERWKFALEGSGDGVWDVDLETGDALFSKRYQEMLGYAKGEFLGTFNEWLDHVHPDDRAGVVETLQSYFDRKIPIYATEFRMQCKSGRYIWISARGMVVSRTADGDPMRMIGTHTDITERKRIDEEVQQYRLHLERLVDERTAALSVAKVVAEAANTAKSKFLAAASHDLRQPLSALGIYIRVLADKVAPADQKIVKSMKECVAGLSGLLNDLLDLSKLSAGAAKVSVDHFPIDQLLDNLRSMHQPVAESKGLRLRCVPAKLIVRTDPVLLQRILGNFIDNALRYTKHGGVVVGCRRRQGKLFVEVWDSGIGIPADKINEIFEEFRQLGDEARTSGSGLGLAIAAKTADLLGLKIQVRSWLGRGSVFAIEIPLGQANTLPASPIRKSPYRSLRIALVEDNHFVQDALTTVMREVGHQVVGASTGDELLGALGALPPDAVVSDYRLPNGITGFDVISALKARFGETLPAIIVSGDTDPALLRDMAGRGIVVLHKPLDLDELLAHIEDMTSPVPGAVV